jgi:tungstate transport system substrate-binding protein
MIGSEMMHLRLVSTISPVEAGMTDWLAQGFSQQRGVEVRVTAAGTGQAMKKAKEGLADILLVHAPAQEIRFVQAGYATGRYALMSTDFLILGPAHDPGGIRGLSPERALQVMAQQSRPFLSRADSSGTHIKETELLEIANTKAGWAGYQSYPQGHLGNQATLRHANHLGCHVLIDRVTYLTLKTEISLVPLVQQHPLLLNPMSLLPMHPGNVHGVNHDLAKAFIHWACSETTQMDIKNFRKDHFGEPLFLPDANPGNCCLFCS